MLHSLQRFRSSLALDVMELVRPAIDQFVLNLLATRVFAPSDFDPSRDYQSLELSAMSNLPRESSWKRLSSDRTWRRDSARSRLDDSFGRVSDVMLLGLPQA